MHEWRPQRLACAPRDASACVARSAPSKHALARTCFLLRRSPRREPGRWVAKRCAAPRRGGHAADRGQQHHACNHHSVQGPHAPLARSIAALEPLRGGQLASPHELHCKMAPWAQVAVATTVAAGTQTAMPACLHACVRTHVCIHADCTCVRACICRCSKQPCVMRRLTHHRRVLAQGSRGGGRASAR